MKIYKGYSFALLSNFLYWTISFYSFDKINSLVNSISEKKDINNTYSGLSAKIATIFGGATLTTVFASSFVYPLDTIKKKLQVNGAFGFEHKYSSGRECILTNLRDIRGLYRGYSLHLMKCIPFGLVHYSVLQRLNGNINSI